MITDIKQTKPFRYAVGMFGTSIPINMFRTYAAIFYVDTLGLTTKAFSLVLLIYTFIDAIDNPVYGFLSDKTRTRWGRRKPWMVIGAPLLGFSFVAFFNPPALEAGTPLFLYFLITYIFTGTLDSLVNANYGALFPALFTDDAVRAKTNAMRQAFQLVAMIVSISLTPMVAERLGYPLTALLYSILGVAVILYMTFGCYEKPEHTHTEKPLLWPTVKAFAKNRKFWTLGVTSALYSAAMSLVLASIPFYVKYALKDERGLAVTLLSATVILISIATIAVWVYFIKKLTLIPAWRRALLAMAIGFIPLFFANNLISAIISGSVLGFGLAGVRASMDLIGARIIDEDSRRYGLRREGMFMSAMGVMNRLNGIFTSFAFYFVFRFYGFENGQNPGSNPGGASKFLLILFPMVLMFLSFALSQTLKFEEDGQDNGSGETE